jgi:lambda repressor-like predicted transcriptional regulator
MVFDNAKGAERLRTELASRGLTGNQLSIDANVNDGVVARALKGRNIAPKSRKAIADQLDLMVLDIWPLLEEKAAA